MRKSVLRRLQWLRRCGVLEVQQSRCLVPVVQSHTQDQLPHLAESLWFHRCSSENHLSRRLGCSFPLEGSDPLDAIGLGWFESQSKALAALPCLTDSSRTTPEGLASNRSESSEGSLRALDLLPTYRSGNPVGLGNRDPIDRTAPWLRFLHLSAD